MSNDDGMDSPPDRCVRGSERMTRMASDIEALRRQVADGYDREATLRSEVKELRGQVDYLTRVVGALVSTLSHDNVAGERLYEALKVRFPNQELVNVISTGRPPHG